MRFHPPNWGGRTLDSRDRSTLRNYLDRAGNRLLCLCEGQYLGVANGRAQTAGAVSGARPAADVMSVNGLARH
jgi:hypothetical protein